MPHSGTVLPKGLLSRLTEEGRSLADTDWHIPQLYNFLDDMDITVIQAKYSRYVADLNRFPDGTKLYPGQSETDIFPSRNFACKPLYRMGQEPRAAEISHWIEEFWKPYHQKLAGEITRVKSEHGFALLWDAHSIQSQVPRFFAGRLPDLNLGTVNGQSCDLTISNNLMKILRASDRFSSVLNGRFKGGAITRSYGNPSSNVHAVQMEIAQICYMSESPEFEFDEDKAIHLRPVLRDMLNWMITSYRD